MEIYYTVGSPNTGDEAEGLPAHALRRQEARSFIDKGAMERIALQEAISLIRLGVADRMRIPREEHLKGPETRAVACAEALASGASVTLGGELVTVDRGPAGVQARTWEASCEAARERHRLLPPTAGATGRGTYISPGRPDDEERSRLAHKLVHEMRYSKAEVARIFERVDGCERPALRRRQGIHRLIREECDGEESRYNKESGVTSRRAGHLHLPGGSFNLHVMAVLGDEGAEAEAMRFDASLTKPHSLVCPVDPENPEQALLKTTQILMDHGIFRTLYVTNPDAVFSSRIQRSVVYDLALFRGVQVVEGGTRIDPGKYNPLLREGTELFAALRIRDNATVVEESRSRAHALKTAAKLRSQGCSDQEVAAELNEEAIPVLRGWGKWGRKSVSSLLSSEQEVDR